MLKAFDHTVHMFQNHDMLPMHVRNFHRWQQELSGFRVGLINTTLSDEQIEEYIIPGTVSYETRKQKMKRRLRDYLIRMMEEMRARLGVLVSYLDSTLNYLDKLDRAVEAEIDRLPEGNKTRENLETLHKKVHQAKVKVQRKKEDVTDLKSERNTINEKDVATLEDEVEREGSYVARLGQFFHGQLRKSLMRQKAKAPIRAAEAINTAYVRNRAFTGEPAFAPAIEHGTIDPWFEVNASNEDHPKTKKPKITTVDLLAQGSKIHPTNEAA